METLLDIQPTNDLLAFDVRRYGRNSFSALVNDGSGLITEKVSGETIDGTENGQFLFNDQTRISLQLTPPEHEYIQLHNSNGDMMVSPENLGDPKDILDSITDWRRGTDKEAMGIVKSLFFSSPVGTRLRWFSPKAEEWEQEEVKRFNGKYGFFYDGEVQEGIDSLGNKIKRLVVHDFKTDLSSEAYALFMLKGADRIVRRNQESERFLDRAMRTVALSQPGNIAETIADTWRGLSEAKKIIEDEDRIFNLDVETIIKLQNQELQTVAREAAVNVAHWIDEQISKGTSYTEIQTQVRQRFTKATIKKLKEYGVTDDEEIDPELLASYSGSNGDRCGGWGEKMAAIKMPSWCENYGGGIRCKHCKKGLTLSGINSHRCIC